MRDCSFLVADLEVRLFAGLVEDVEPLTLAGECFAFMIELKGVTLAEAETLIKRGKMNAEWHVVESPVIRQDFSDWQGKQTK